MKQLDQRLNQTGINPDDQLVILQEGLAQERDALYNVEVFMRLPFGLMPCNSTRLTSAQADSLKNQTAQITASLESLKQELADCQNCSTTSEIMQEIER